MPTIAIDIRVLGTQRISGVEEYTEQLLAHMMPLRSDVHYKLFFAGPTPERRPWMDAPNVTLHRIAASNRLLWARTLLVGRPFLDAAVGGADVCFFPHFLLGATSPACRRVMTWHDLSFERMPELFSWRRRFWHHVQMRPRWQARHADHLIAVSESTRDDVRDLYGISDDRISVIPSGVDTSLTRASDAAIAALRTELALPERFLLAFGTIEPRKNLQASIAAFERIAAMDADLHLVLVGSRGWLWRPILRQARASQYAARIHIRDPIQREQRAALLSAASILLYPSLLEGFGFPPLEALQCGTPVIAGANSSLFETVGHAGLLVSPYSVDELVLAVQSFLYDTRLRDRFLTHYQNGKRYAWEQTAKSTLETLCSVV